MNEIKNSSTSWKFPTVKTLIQEKQIDNFPFEKFSATRMFAMPTLTEEIKPVCLVKYELEYREKQKFLCFPWNFWTNRIMCKKETMTF